MLADFIFDAPLRMPAVVASETVAPAAAQPAPQYDAVVDYLTAVTGEAGLNACYKPGADMVELEQAA